VARKPAQEIVIVDLLFRLSCVNKKKISYHLSKKLHIFASTNSF